MQLFNNISISLFAHNQSTTFSYTLHDKLYNEEKITEKNILI